MDKDIVERSPVTEAAIRGQQSAGSGRARGDQRSGIGGHTVNAHLEAGAATEGRPYMSFGVSRVRYRLLVTLLSLTAAFGTVRVSSFNGAHSNGAQGSGGQSAQDQGSRSAAVKPKRHYGRSDQRGSDQQSAVSGQRGSGQKQAQPAMTRIAAPNPENPDEGGALVTAQDSGAILATVDFNLLGLAVTAGPATQDVPKNTPTVVNTSVQVPAGVDPSIIISQINPNYKVFGDLSGPSLSAPVTLQASIGQPLQIPPLSVAGDHILQNLRVVDTGTAGNPVIAPVTPDSVGITVIEQLLVSTVQVNPLTYDQISQLGISINQDSYNFFNFTLGLATTSGVQQVSVPVAMPGVTLPQQTPPVVGTPVVNAPPGVKVPAFDVAPVMLQIDQGDGPPIPQDFEFDGGPVRIPGVVVFPGRIGFLHQFFQAIVIVSNGAPNNSNLVVQNLTAQIVLPGTPGDPSDPLIIAPTQSGGAVTTLPIHGLGPDGVYGTADDTTSFQPGQSGQAPFLIEGMQQGLFPISFNLQGTLTGLPIGPVTVKGTVPGSVLVRDPTFSVTFMHPSVVRAGQLYNLAMTLNNTGAQPINGAVANLAAGSISGAELLPGDNGSRSFATTIAPQQSATVTWQLKSDTTGQVTASYVKVGDSVSAGLILTTGVGDRNVPLSPDSLILPAAANFLPPPIVAAAEQSLGQAWGVATAPAGSLPNGVNPIDSRLVMARASDVAIAGLRVEFGEGVETSIQTLVRDWLGELDTPSPDIGFADSIRNTPSGFNWYDTVGADFASRLKSTSQPITPATFHAGLASTESSRSEFVSALVDQAEGPPIFGVQLIDPNGNVTGENTSITDRQGNIELGADLRLNTSAPGATPITTLGEMVLASQVASGPAGQWTLVINGWAAGTADVSLLVPTGAHSYNQYVFAGVQINAGGQYKILFQPGASATPTLESVQNGQLQPSSITAAATFINEPAPAIEGVMQVTPDIIDGGDKYGRIVGILYSKPVAQSTGGAAANYQIQGGTLIGSNPAQQIGSPVSVTDATVNFGNRMVLLALDSPIGPFVQRSLVVNGVTDQRGIGLPGAPLTEQIQITVSPQQTPPGAYLTGQVLNGDGSPVSGALVYYQVQPCDQADPVVVSSHKTDANGNYEFDYVRNGTCGPVVAVTQNPTTGATKSLSTPVVYHGQHLVLNLVFLARGSVQGNVTVNGSPAPGAVVTVRPTLDPSARTMVQCDGAGNYTAANIPVGPVGVTAQGIGSQFGATGANAGNVTGPGAAATVNISMLSVSGTVTGEVLHADQSPVVGTLVVAYAFFPGGSAPSAVGFAYSDTNGQFKITALPAQAITVTAADFVTGIHVSQIVQLSTTNPEVDGVVLTLPANGAISGKVIDDTGVFIPNAIVLAAGTGVQADVGGNYTIPSLPAGTVTVTATDPASGSSGAATVTVVAGQTVQNVNIVVSRRASLTGHVFIVNGSGSPVPVAGAIVTLDGIPSADGSFPTTDASGAYSISNVIPGGYELRVIHPNNLLAVNVAIQFGSGESLVQDATFHSDSVHGHVFQPDGVTGAVAQIIVSSQAPHLTADVNFGLLELRKSQLQSGSDGSYSITNLNPGRYTVSAFNNFFPTTVNKGGTLGNGDNQQCDLVLVNTLAGKIQGTVFQPDGKTPVGAGVQVTLGGGALADVTVSTDSTGSFQFAQVFAAGGYSLTATDPSTGATNQIQISVATNQDLIANIRLLGTGNLAVTVVDGAGNPVQTGSVTLDGAAYPRTHKFIDIGANGSNVVQFTGLFEGPYAIAASQNGLSARASATVTLGGQAQITVTLAASGTVTGAVLMPDGVTPVPLADVQLVANSGVVGVTTSSDSDTAPGSFTFGNVPLGNYSLTALDNRTGRQGRAFGALTSQGQTSQTNIVLVALGAVAGRVTQNGAPVNHATVNIVSSPPGLTSVSLTATTDPNGNFRFPGLSAGPFTVSASFQGLGGSTSGVIAGTTDPIPDTIANIVLQPTTTITGHVFQLGGATPVAGAAVVLIDNGNTFRTSSDASGVYTLLNAPLGTISVQAFAPTGFDRGSAGPVTASQAGGSVNLDVSFVGTGGVAGTALDSSGSPLTIGTVTLTSTTLGNLTFAVPVQSNGSYQIGGVPAGPFSILLTTPGRIETGSAAGTVAANQTLSLNLQLAPAGTITGTVTEPDGVTPSVSADVNLTLVVASSGTTLNLLVHTNAQGVYTFANVPLGTGKIAISDPNTGGLGKVASVTLGTDGQTLTVPAVVLDNTPISVLSATPAAGAAGVPLATTVIVVFNKPADPTTVTTGSVRLLASGAGVSSQVALSSDGKTATLTPSSALASATVYTIDVSTGVADFAGHQLAGEFQSTFTTADVTPPAVASVSPANNATGVPVATPVVVTFTKALDPSQNLGGIVALTLGPAPGTAVPGTAGLDSTGKVLTFTPSAALTDSTVYTVTVNGAKDTVGNVQTTAFTSAFTTVDLTPPVVDPLPIDGTSPATLQPTITATYHDNLSGVNPATVGLTLDGTNVTAGASVTATSLSYTPPAPLAKGSHTVTVQVSDFAGNKSAVRTATFTISNVAPIINSFTIGGLTAVNGLVVPTLQPAFVATFTSANTLDTTQTRLLLGPQGSTPTQVAASVTSTALSFTPASPLAQGGYVTQLNVVDTLGNSATSGLISFTINATGPLVQSVTPSTGSQHGGTAVTLTGLRLVSTTGAGPAVTIGGSSAIVTGSTPRTGGSPDQVTLVTPAGSPGAAAITVTNDHGVGSLAGGFTYQADPKTPFASEADTLLLWHLDEIANGAIPILDSGPAGINGVADAASTAVPGRFAGGRANANAFINSDARVLETKTTGANSFTVECWVNTQPVTRSYTLVGKGNTGGEDWSLYLDPLGNLNWFLNNGPTFWITSVTRATHAVDDGQWHYIAAVMDWSSGGHALVYVDGVLQASSAPPSGFVSVQNQNVSIGIGDASIVGTGGKAGPDGPGGIQFPGSLDEIRISSTAHSPQKIQQIFQGAAGNLGLAVTRANTSTVPRGQATEIDLSGYNLTLSGASAIDGAGAAIPVTIITASDTLARVQLTPAAAAALGAGMLQVSSASGTANVPIQIVDLSHIVFAPESDTLLLWHLDETGNGAVTIADSSASGINGTSDPASLAVPGLFGGARANANAFIDADGGVLEAATTAANSFTVDCWLKTSPVTRSYSLVGKGNIVGEDWSLYLDPLGNLNWFLNNGPTFWITSVRRSAHAVDDGQWHYIVGVVDWSSGGQAFLYVDGVLQASSSAPSGFSGIQNQNVPVGIGDASIVGTGGVSGLDGPGGVQFPGALDEVRISNTAHSATRVAQDYAGTRPFQVTSYSPAILNRDKSSTQPVINDVTVNGYGLDQASATLERGGQATSAAVTTLSSSYRQAIFSVAIPQTLPLGAAQLVISAPGQAPVSLNVTVVEQSPFVVAPDTLLLWHLDESANGGVTVLDSGINALNGTADPASIAVPGRFGGARENAAAFVNSDAGFIEKATTGNNSFTVECWVKTQPVTRSYSLVGKGNGAGEDWSLYLDPLGNLNWFLNSGPQFWITSTSRRASPVDDGQWHYIAAVADWSSGGRALLYVDGMLRAGSTAPSGFAKIQNQSVPVGIGDASIVGTAGKPGQDGPGAAQFPGALDEVRISSSAEAAAQIATDYFGQDAPLVTQVKPAIVQQGGAAAQIKLSGQGLSGVSVISPVQGVTVSGVTPSPDGASVSLSVTVAANAPLGPLGLTVTDALGQSTTADISVVNQQAFDPSVTGTLLLWHLDETANGAVTIADAGPQAINGTADASSTAVPGRFNNGRANADILSNADSGLIEGQTAGSNSFTAECWVNTGPVARSYSMVARGNDNFEDWGLYLDPSGALTLFLFDGSNEWFTTVARSTYQVEDSSWHYISAVMDWSARTASIYIDGALRGSSAMPSGFGPVSNRGIALAAGRDSAIGQGGTGPAQFPGILDEIRILGHARTAAQISDTWNGTNTGGSGILLLPSNPRPPEVGTPAASLTIGALSPASVDALPTSTVASSPNVSGILANPAVIRSTAFRRVVPSSPNDSGTPANAAIVRSTAFRRAVPSSPNDSGTPANAAIVRSTAIRPPGASRSWGSAALPPALREGSAFSLSGTFYIPGGYAAVGPIPVRAALRGRPALGALATLWDPVEALIHRAEAFSGQQSAVSEEPNPRGLSPGAARILRAPDSLPDSQPIPSGGSHR